MFVQCVRLQLDALARNATVILIFFLASVMDVAFQSVIQPLVEPGAYPESTAYVCICHVKLAGRLDALAKRKSSTMSVADVFSSDTNPRVCEDSPPESPVADTKSIVT